MKSAAFHSIQNAMGWRRACWMICILASPLAAWPQASPQLSVFTTSASAGDTQTIIIEITGTTLNAPDDPRVMVYPGGASEVTILGTITATSIRGEFTAPKNYVLGGVLLSHASGAPIAIAAQKACNPSSDLQSSYTLVPRDQAREKYGNGVDKYFDVIQISIVNNCAAAVVIPLAGFRISVPDGQTARVKANYVVPFSLEHVTSVYSTDRKLTGRRAVFFNILQAVATLGSAVEPFFGHGFTQGVAIEGGGFTQAMQTVMKDMSAEQLQNITSQSFGSTEQVGPNGGALQKFLFVQKSPAASAAGGRGKLLSLFDRVSTGNVGLTFVATPIQAAGGTAQATRTP